MHTVRVPAGRYYLGDPCHVIDSQDDWMELLETCNFFQGSPIGTLKGHQVLAFGTAYGDGSYDDKYTGKIVGVDAGIIGLVPEALMDLPAVDGIGFMVEFKYDTEATDDGRGDLTFGEHRFDTAGIDDDEDSYECFECGEQWCEGECAWEEE
jgi:hypothetical protein